MPDDSRDMHLDSLEAQLEATIARADALSKENERLRTVFHKKPLRPDDMDVCGSTFGIRFVDGCANGCAELYVEDDGWWHFKLLCDRSWLKELESVAEIAAHRFEKAVN